MLVRDVMSINAAHIQYTANIKTAVELLSFSKVSDLMVVDESHNFQGVLSEGDLIRVMLPDPLELKQSKAFLAQAADLFIEHGKRISNQPIDRLVIKNPIVVLPNDPVLVAAAVMVEKQIRCLPVVQFGKLLGTISRSDVCWLLVCN